METQVTLPALNPTNLKKQGCSLDVEPYGGSDLIRLEFPFGAQANLWFPLGFPLGKVGPSPHPPTPLFPAVNPEC